MNRSTLLHLAWAAGLFGATVLTAGIIDAANSQAVAFTRPSAWHPLRGKLLPTGMRITPQAAKSARFESLNPNLPMHPDYLADHAVDTAISPNGKTMLVLTSGYNRLNSKAGATIPQASNEYVFIYDISGGAPRKKQVLQVPNTFNGIAWNPSPQRPEFYVSGGVNDNVHIYSNRSGLWAEDGMPIPLGHEAG